MLARDTGLGLVKLGFPGGADVGVGGKIQGATGCNQIWDDV